MDVYYSKDKKPCGINTIAEIIEKIAHSQRDICSTCVETVGCNVCFFNSQFNTIPIRLTYCCGGNPVEGIVGVGGPATTYFRVECISDERYVKLRLLTATAVGEEVVLTGTNYTIVVDLDCVRTIQCFEPVNITAAPVA